MTRQYWIGVASFDHVVMGVEGGFCQLCHGKSTPLKRMKKNDVIIYYSPSKHFGIKDLFQSFCAIGKIENDVAYQYKMRNEFVPYRRDVSFYTKVHPVNIHSILEQLDFIQDKKKYGAAFRFGHIKISKKDAMTIWHAMKNES